MQTLPTVLCVTGLAAEAKVARAAGFQAIIGASDPDRTAALVAAAARRADYLVSFGIAGALAPSLRRGDVILSGHVIAQDRQWRPVDDLNIRIGELARQIGAFEGPVFGARMILASEDAKTAARRETGALAVDLESAVVARAAEELGIPFLVLRAIADPATRALPPAALIPLNEDGTPALVPILAEVLRRPRQIPALIRVALETRRALTALVGPARRLHGMLGAAA